jgi:hypothetical protein
MKALFMTLFLLTLFSASTSKADLSLISPQVLKVQLSISEKLYSNKDVDGLIKQMNTTHLLIAREAALKLGRLGAVQALPQLKKMNDNYCDFACAPSGHFAIAICLIKHKTIKTQKKALMSLASNNKDCTIASQAARELARYGDSSLIEALLPIKTYGAQYTVLKLQCEKLSDNNEAITLCINVLKKHQTPLKAQAAQELLISYGAAAKKAIRVLLSKIETGQNSTKTTVNRCQQILRAINCQ